MESIEIHIDDEFLDAIMLQELTDDCEPKAMALENSVAAATSDFIKLKLLQVARQKMAKWLSHCK